MRPSEDKSSKYENQSSPQRRFSFYSDWVILIIAGIILFPIAYSFDLFDKLVIVFMEFEHLQLDEVFVTLVGLNLVFIGLLIRNQRRLRRQADHDVETERQMARERVLLRTVIDYLPDYIFVKDREGRFILSNVAHARAVKATPEELIGKKADEMFPANLAAQFGADDEQIMSSNQPLINAERTTIDADGNNCYVLTTKVPICDEDGQVIGLVGISRDITHRKLEEHRALELAQERERVKMMSLFTRDAAHDFRTPLATISTSAYLLLRSPEPERQQQHANNIDSAVIRLRQLIDSLIVMTQLDSAEQLETRLLDVNRLVESAVEFTSSVNTHPQLEIERVLDNTLPRIQGAEAELQHALGNIIDNAVQFTPDGGRITLRTTRVGEDVLIEVQDTGIGVSAQDLSHVFDRFFRTDKARSSETGGIGLGLSISKRIIELHDGRIEAESLPGSGSTFRVYLPADSDTP